jgi:hypothetical protein
VPLVIAVHAAFQVALFAGVTDDARYARRLVRVRIGLDILVAVVALEAAVNAGAELVTIHCKAVSRGILPVFVGMAGETISLRDEFSRP